MDGQNIFEPVNSGEVISPAQESIEALKKAISKYGVPTRIYLDTGEAFIRVATIQQAVADVMRDNLDGEIAELEAIRSTLLDILEAVYGIDLSKNAVGRAIDRYQTQQAIITGRGR